MPQVFYILFGAVFTAAISMALGKMLLRALSVRLYRQEEHLLGFVTGAALLSTITFGLCALHLARKGVFLWLGIAILALAWRRGIHRSRGDSLLPLKRPWSQLFRAVFWIYFVLYLVNAMAPESSPDGSTYHLGLVARYAREFGFPRITTNMYANLSQGVEMLFLHAFVFGKHSASALVHFAWLLALPLLMVCYGRRFGWPLAGVCGAIFVFVSPVVGIDGTSAYIDVAVASIGFALFYLLQIWDEQRQTSLSVPIGLVAGFGYAAKYTAFLGVPYALAFIAWRGRARGTAKALSVIAVCAAAMIVPWTAKNWIVLGNPFSPFLNAVFPNPYIQVGFEQQYAWFMRHYEAVKSYWQVPWMVTVGGQLAGLIGPLFLLAPVGLLALRWKEGRRLLLAALVFGLPYFANIGTRFLIPALPFVSFAMAMAFTGIRRLASGMAIAHAVLSFPMAVASYADPIAWRLVKFPLHHALRLKSEEDFLLSRMQGYAIAREIDRLVPPQEKVFSFSPVPEAYTSREVAISYQSASGNVIRDILLTPLIPEFVPNWWLSFQFPRQPLRRIRVVQTAAGSPDQWNVSELRVFSENREVPRSPRWRLRARPNPWDVQLAFDSSPVTRWHSWLPLAPGQFLEIDFGEPLRIDQVRVECAHDQYGIRLKLEGQGAAGAWSTISSAPEIGDSHPPFGLRAAAVQEVKARGFNYLVVYDEDFGAQDLRTGRRAWGIRQVTRRGAARLYYLEGIGNAPR